MSESIDWTQPAEAILDQLLETVERRIPADKSRDDTAWVQLNRIAHVFDSSILKEMKQSLVRNGYEDFYQILIGGDDFGKPKVQAILDALSQIDPAVFTPSRVQTMKSWGVDRRPRWTLEGFASQPTLGVVEFEASRRIAIDDTGKRINRAGEARRKAIDNAESTGDEITTATEEAFG